MENSIIIRIIRFSVLIPIVAYLKKQRLQAKKDKDLLKLQDYNLEPNTINQQDIKSEFIDTYNHPDYFTTTGGFLSIFVLWVISGIIIPISLYFIFNLSITSISIASFLILCASIYLLFYSINMNKDCVLINLYTDKIR